MGLSPNIGVTRPSLCWGKFSVKCVSSELSWQVRSIRVMRISSLLLELTALLLQYFKSMARDVRYSINSNSISMLWLVCMYLTVGIPVTIVKCWRMSWVRQEGWRLVQQGVGWQLSPLHSPRYIPRLQPGLHWSFPTSHYWTFNSNYLSQDLSLTSINVF